MDRERWWRRLPIGARGATLLAIGVAFGWAVYTLRLDPRDLLPGEGGLAVAQEFLSRAFSPALSYEADFVPEGTPPLPVKAFYAAGQTVIFAAAALSLALVVGMGLGFLGSTAWWIGRRKGFAIPLLYGGVRLLITLMRSVHELLWAILFLAAFGLNHLSAVIAIAIPYGGTLAKVFSEMIDEAPRGGAAALRGVGASGPQLFLVGLLPRALPDMVSYAFYRFECGLRSSAVLGFFGFPTLGYFIVASFENLHYGEVWTYLYTLCALVLVADFWSGALRRRLVS